MATRLYGSGNVLGSAVPAVAVALPYLAGVTLLHLFNNSKYLSGSSLTNLAGIGAPASTISGSPTFTPSAGTLKLNTAGTDYLTTALFDTGGDISGYFVVQNNDTLAAGTNQPVFISNASSDAAHGSIPAGTKGVTMQPSSTTQVAVHDYQLISGASTNKSVTGTVPNLATTTKWSLLAFTSATTGGSTSVITFYDLTLADAETAVVTTTTGTSGRAFNATDAFRLGLGNGSNYGLCTYAFAMLCQTATGGGGAHPANQVSANGRAIAQIMSSLGISV